MEQLVEYMLRVQKLLPHRLPRIAWEASQKKQKTHKSKILSSGWMQDIDKWFARWDALHLLKDASRDHAVNEAFLQRQCIKTWESSGSSRFKHYTTHIAPNYTTISKRSHPYLLEPIPLSAICTIASIRLSSHSL